MTGGLAEATRGRRRLAASWQAAGTSNREAAANPTATWHRCKSLASQARDEGSDSETAVCFAFYGGCLSSLICSSSVDITTFFNSLGDQCDLHLIGLHSLIHAR